MNAKVKQAAICAGYAVAGLAAGLVLALFGLWLLDVMMGVCGYSC